MLGLLLWASAVTISGGPASFDEVSRAIQADRLTQARSMIAAAVAKGAEGREVDRLLADLAYAEGDYPLALARYLELLQGLPAESYLLQQAALSALAAGKLDEAEQLAGRIRITSATGWRVFNMKGVIADFRGRWAEADRAYADALRSSPGKSEVINNQGWSQLLRGNWSAAVALFEQASARNARLLRVSNNLELARAALAAGLPERRQGETAEAWALRLNDAGVAALRRGDRPRAIMAFVQAIEAHGSWYDRAANNLATVESGR